MRWFVEVTPGGASEASEKWVVEAAQWQPALQAARTLRGDSAQMQGFSVELLADGSRSLDPATMARYLVRRAPDEAPLSVAAGDAKSNGASAASPNHPTSGSVPAPAGPAAAGLPVLGGMTAGPVVAPPRPASVPPGPTAAAAHLSSPALSARPAPFSALRPSLGSSPALGSTAPPAAMPAAPAVLPAPSVPAAPTPAASTPAVSVPLPSAIAASGLAAASASAGSAAASAVSSPAASTVAPAGPSASVSPAAVLPASPAVLPAPISPLDGGGEPIGAPSAPPDALLRARMEAIGDLLGVPAVRAKASPSARPPALPVVGAGLLSERSEPASAEVPFTYREAVWFVPPGTPGHAAAALLQGQLDQIRASLAAHPPGKLVRLAAFDHRFEGKPQRPPLVTLTWKDWKQGEPEIQMGSAARSPSSAPPAGAMARPVLMPESAPSVPPAAAASSPLGAAAAEAAPVPAAPALAPPASIPSATSALAPTPASEPAPIAAAEPAANAPPEPAATAAPEPAPAPLRPAPSTPRVRLSGDELISDLFEAMHELHFHRDALDGSEFVLALASEKLVSRFGLVHLYDINAREFVVVRAVAPDPKRLVGFRTSEKEPLIAQAMRARRAVLVADAAGDDRVRADGRWALFGAPLVSVLCAPVEIGGRFLGAIELANPRDGGAFTEGEGHALTYLGEQLAEFVAARGVVLDPERIKA